MWCVLFYFGTLGFELGGSKLGPQKTTKRKDSTFSLEGPKTRGIPETMSSVKPYKQEEATPQSSAQPPWEHVGSVDDVNPS